MLNPIFQVFLLVLAFVVSAGCESPVNTRMSKAPTSIQSVAYATSQPVLIAADGHIDPTASCAITRREPSTGGFSATLASRPARVYEVAVNRDGSRVAVANRVNPVTIHPGQGPGPQLDSFGFTQGTPLCVACDPTSDLVVAGSDRGQIAVRKNAETIRHNVPLQVIDSIAVNPIDPKQLAYATSQQSKWGVELMVRDTGQSGGTVCQNVAQVRDIAFTNDGHTLVAGGARGQGDDTQKQGRIQAVGLPGLTPMWELDEPFTVKSLSISQDGSKLAVAYQQVVVIRTMTDGRMLHQFTYGAEVTDIAFDQTQPTRLAVGLLDGSITIQSVP